MEFKKVLVENVSSMNENMQEKLEDVGTGHYAVDMAAQQSIETKIPQQELHDDIGGGSLRSLRRHLRKGGSINLNYSADSIHKQWTNNTLQEFQAVNVQQ
ncbi:hypothetical protein SAY87_003260 [Trapa incisa]|uniref:Uncharacterized protein n=1 Tax=Trapa incisa TaxID=236973 RepID=A0AAN7KN90_9MYRT|nr:hypothetical protein SAY87_003260 [Trapa incisa]